MANKNINLNEETLVRAAFERVLPELKALDESDLRPITLEIPAAVITVLGVLEEVEALRPRIVAELRAFDISHVDKLEDYALALSHINNRYQAATKDPDDLEAFATEASKLRERYLAEARSLTHHGVIKESELANLKGANGRKNVANDLGVLVGVLEAAWPKIEGKTLTKLEDLEHASRVATRVQRIMGAKEQGPSLVAEVTDHRLRAYTKLMDVYESIQRAVAFLRGARYDADTIIPSLHKGSPGPRGKEEETTAPAGGVSPPATGTAPGTSGTAPTVATTPAFAPDAFGPGGPFMPKK